MNKANRFVLGLLMLFAIYHLVRDVMQDFGMVNAATLFLKTERNWCGFYCNMITYPFELFILFGSALILRWGTVGWLGRAILTVFCVWLAMFLYDYFIFN